MKKKQYPKLKKYPNGGKKKTTIDPYITEDPNDPRIQQYNDSLTVSNASARDMKVLVGNVATDEKQLLANQNKWMNKTPQNAAYHRMANAKTDMTPAKVVNPYLYNPDGTLTPPQENRYIADYSNFTPQQPVIYQPKNVPAKPTVTNIKADGKKPVVTTTTNATPSTPTNYKYSTTDKAGNTYNFVNESGTVKAVKPEEYNNYYSKFPVYKYGGKQLPKYENGAETTSMMAEYGVDNPELYNPADPNRGKNTGNYINYGMTAANTLGQVQATNQDASLNSTQKAQAQSGAINQGVDQVAGNALPWYGLAMGASNIGRNMVKKDENGKPANSNARATDALMKPIHQQQIDAATSGNWGDFIGSTLGAGFYAPIKAKLKDDYQYPMGGTNMQPNAEVEKQEMMRMPDGSTEQVDGPSHEQGGVPVNIPTGTEIFSDRLKNPITKMTFAKEAAKYKIKEGDKLSATEQLKNSIRQKKLDQIFQAQETLKQEKVSKYAKKMGMNPDQFSNGGVKKYAGVPPYETDGRFVPEGWETKSVNGMSPMIESMDPSMKPFSDLSESSSMMNEYRESNPELYDNKLPMDKKEIGSNQYPNLRDNLGLAGNIIGQNVGNIADLYMTKFGKKYDKENSGQLTSQKLDPTQALIDADIQNQITRGALSGAANGNAGAYMSNAIQAGALNTVNKAGIRQKYDAANTQIANADLYHNQATKIQDKMNEQQNKARSEDIARTAIRGAGTNTAAAIKDYKAGKMDKYALDLISKAYPDYEYDSSKRVWKHKKTGKKLEATQ